MKNTDPDILVQRFVDGDLSDREVRTALHRIADDPEARDLLQFELEMTQDLAARPAADPPSNFADRTMAALSEDPAPDSSRSRREEWTAWWRSLTAPVAVEVRPLAAMAVAVLLAVGAWIVWPAAPTGPSPTAETASTTPASSPSVQQASASTSASGSTVWIRFLYTNSEADSVAVAGDFSQWDPIPLSPRTVNGETVWTGLVPVSRGEHEYQFVINGERWVTDPLAPVKRSDGFGAKNAVLEL
jgi:hypothetical protein